MSSVQNWILSLLHTVIKNIIPDELKQVSVCHSTVQAARIQSSLSCCCMELVFLWTIHMDQEPYLTCSLELDSVEVMTKLSIFFKQSAVLCDHDQLQPSQLHSTGRLDPGVPDPFINF